MTRSQEVPDLTHVLEALVPTRELELPASEKEIEKVLREGLSRRGASAVAFERPPHSLGLPPCKASINVPQLNIPTSWLCVILRGRSFYLNCVKLSRFDLEVAGCGS
jgi:hypothetical protein